MRLPSRSALPLEVARGGWLQHAATARVLAACRGDSWTRAEVLRRLQEELERREVEAHETHEEAELEHLVGNWEEHVYYERFWPEEWLPESPGYTSD